ncbi:MAG: dipeptide/oligopeptide/nickel ABC transporter permease/ATP-binding protein [Microbacterium sp.]
MTATATAIAVVSGLAIGAAIWLAPRRIRESGLRILEIAVSYPGLLVALVLAAILGSGAISVVFAIGLANIPAFARLTANLAGNVSRRDFVVTARLLGVPGPLVITRHILPNIAEPLLILSASAFATSLMEISGLSFVGLGVQAPDYDFGKLLADALPAIYSRPIEVVGPALMLAITSLAAMLIGDGLAAAADPRGSGRYRMRIHRTAPGSAQRSDGATLVRVENLRVSRPDGVELVHGVSFSIDKGEILGVVGESGSGKSLTAMALAQLLSDELIAEAEHLSVGDLDLRGTVPARRLATDIALVYQDPGSTFNPALRLGRQLTEVLRTHRGLSARDADERIVDALDQVRITSPRARLVQHPHQLSGGMRQRAMIAAALAVEPRLIIADEPTTALDVTVQAEILREFRRINGERRTSMLFISHDIGVVEALCDRVIVMRDGVIVEETTAARIAARDVEHPYTRMLLEATPKILRSTDGASR